MNSSANTKKDALKKSYLMELPVELHLRIRDQLRKDPDITFGELRSLRLVCKTFDAVWSAVVNTNLVLFPGGPDNLVQLRYLVDGKGKAYSAVYKTLTIKNVRSVETEVNQWRTDVTEYRNEGLFTMFRKVGTSTIALISNILIFGITVLSGLVPISLLIKLVIEAPRQLRNAYNAAQLRNYVTSLPRKLNLPNVRCARLLYNNTETDWTTDLSTKILVSLQQLTELELAISDATDVDCLVRCLEPLTGLQKLSLLPSMVTSSQARSIGSLIARNKNLTHITCNWQTAQSFDLKELFCEVPATTPLKLEHVSFHGTCTNFEALLPHIQSLSSFDFHASERNTWCPALIRAKIFPPMIKVDCLDSELVLCIGAHPRIVNFTVSAYGVSVDAYPDSIQYPSLFKALVQHTESLKYLFIHTEILPIMLQTPAERMSFLRCVINLQEMVLMHERSLAEYPDPDAVIQDEKRILPVIALGRSLTLVIRSKDKTIYTLCRQFCIASDDNPLLQDLAGRIEFEKYSSNPSAEIPRPPRSTFFLSAI
ncbi:hypothetical protein JOM56_009957 [Amanita muscaria]